MVNLFFLELFIIDYNTLYNMKVYISCFGILLIIVFGSVCTTPKIHTTTSSEDAAVVLANQIKPILQKVSETRSIYVAIIPLSGPKGMPTSFGRRMAALLQKNLLSDRWKILEREQIEKILVEHRLVQTGLASEKEYIKASTIAGADFIIVGNTFYGKRAFVNVKVINVATSSVEGVAQVYIAFKE